MLFINILEQFEHYEKVLHLADSTFFHVAKDKSSNSNGNPSRKKCKYLIPDKVQS